MKKILLLLSSATLLFNSYSQSYNFSVSTGNYTDLTGATSLNSGLTWDDPSYSVALGFTLDFFDTTITNLEMAWGYGGDLNSDGTYVGGGIGSIVSVYGADLIDRGSTTPGTSLSNISYKVEGVSGSQIFKMEWNNVGFYNDDDDNGICEDSLNFQVWFYEGSNDIEIHFGPKSITQPSLDFGGKTGASIGLFPRYDFDVDDLIANENGIALSGNPLSTTVNNTDSVDYFAINGVIPNGTIYKFARVAPLSVAKNEGVGNLQLYPNPASDKVYIKNLKDNKAIINVIGANGQLVKTTTVNADNSIDVADLQEGVYIIEITNKEGEKAIKRLIKQ